MVFLHIKTSQTAEVALIYATLEKFKTGSSLYTVRPTVHTNQTELLKKALQNEGI